MCCSLIGRPNYFAIITCVFFSHSSDPIVGYELLRFTKEWLPQEAASPFVCAVSSNGYREIFSAINRGLRKNFNFILAN